MAAQANLLGQSAPTTGALLAFPRRPPAPGPFFITMPDAQLRHLASIDAPICDGDRLLAAAEIRRLRASRRAGRKPNMSRALTTDITVRCTSGAYVTNTVEGRSSIARPVVLRWDLPKLKHPGRLSISALIWERVNPQILAQNLLRMNLC